MNPPASDPVESGPLRGSPCSVRWIHAVTGALMLVCIATAAILYNGSLAVLFGHRYVVEQIHVWCGFALPAPLIAGLASPSYRADLRRLNRFTPRDWQWLRSSSRRDGSIPVGKFNAGQKLNAALSAGAIGVLLATGVIMYFTEPDPAGMAQRRHVPARLVRTRIWPARSRPCLLRAERSGGAELDAQRCRVPALGAA